MKKIITLIVVVLVAFGLYTYFNQKNVAQAPEAQTSVQTEGVYTPKTTFTGTKNLALLKSTFGWQGQKTVFKEWIDKGFIDAQSGALSFNNGYITGGEVVMNMNSIKAIQTGSGNGQDQLSKHLKSKDFFDVEKFPTATFTITKVENNMMSGNITIKGVTQPISFPIVITETENEYMVSGTATIDRTLFGVEFGSTNFVKDLADKAIIDNTFTLDFKLVLE